LAQDINAVLKAWLQYCGRFYRSVLYAVFDSSDQHLVRWVRRKYKRLKDKVSRARELGLRKDISGRACLVTGFWRNAVGSRRGVYARCGARAWSTTKSDATDAPLACRLLAISARLFTLAIVLHWNNQCISLGHLIS
jgi:hypothetical protein